MTGTSADTVQAPSAREAAEEALLPAVARGEPGAVERCVARYGALVWSIARRLSPSRHDAEDATQEIFLDLWKCAERFDARSGTERVFVTVVARRRLIDRLRRRRLRMRLETELPDEQALANLPAADHAHDDAVEAQLAHAALQELPKEQQRAIELSVVYGLSHSEIAAQTGMPLGTVKTMVRRGLLKVRQALQVPPRADAAVAGVRKS